MNIKEIVNEYRSKNGDGNLTNKELLWFMLKKFDDLEVIHSEIHQRVAKIESKIKMLMWFVPIAIGATAVIISLV